MAEVREARAKTTDDRRETKDVRLGIINLLLVPDNSDAVVCSSHTTLLIQRIIKCINLSRFEDSNFKIQRF